MIISNTPKCYGLGTDEKIEDICKDCKRLGSPLSDKYHHWMMTPNASAFFCEHKIEPDKCASSLHNENVEMDWSEPYLKLEQSHKALKDALNQERYEDAEELTYTIAESLYNLQAFVGDKIDG